MTFEEYLTGKKIHPADFQKSETQRWEEYKTIFEQMHPESFTAQKKFVINNLRRLYPLNEASVTEAAPKPTRQTDGQASKPSIPSKLKKAETASADTPASMETTPPDAGVEPAKKPGKPVMRPVVKKPATDPTAAEPTQVPSSESEVTPPAEAPKKPARPVIKPVIKKPTTDILPAETLPSDESVPEPTEEKQPESIPPKKPRPVIRPVIRKPKEE